MSSRPRLQRIPDRRRDTVALIVVGLILGLVLLAVVAELQHLTPSSCRAFTADYCPTTSTTSAVPSGAAASPRAALVLAAQRAGLASGGRLAAPASSGPGRALRWAAGSARRGVATWSAGVSCATRGGDVGRAR